MTRRASLERQYRLLACAFPSDWRRRNGDQLVATLLDASRPGQRIASPLDAFDVLRRGLGCRLATAGPSMQIGFAVALLLTAVGVVHLAVVPLSATFLVTSLVVVLVPGTGVVFSVSTALTSGWRTGGLAAIGCTLGIVPHLVAAAAGVSGLMQTSAEIFELVRWLGVAYLLYLAVGMLRSTGRLDVSDRAEPGGAADDLGVDETRRSGWSTIRQAILLNLLNPKLTIFFFAFLPQFLPSSAGALDPRLFGLSAVFMAMTLAVFLVYVAVAAGLRRQVLGRPTVLRRIERSLGVVLVGFAARLAVADR
ncbi:MAG: LysE family translocator [Actinomycetota bacterium]